MINQNQLIQSFWQENLDQISSFLGEHDEEIHDIKVSLSIFCKNYKKDFYTDSDLNFLLSHSLYSVGNEKKAYMLLQNDKNYKFYAKIWIRCFNRIKNFNLLFPFISNGLISLDFFSGAKNDIILALNLDKLSINDDEYHEIVIYKMVYLLINHICDCWNFNSNDIVFAVKGLRSQKLTKIFAFNKSSYANEIFEFIEYIFKKNKIKYGWEHAPKLLIF